MNSPSINGVIAITGAGQGIGLAIAIEAAKRGFDVLALVLFETMIDTVKNATESLPGKVRCEVLDVTQPDDFTFPENLQVLINNAGIRPNSFPVEETGMDEYRKVFDVNFFGALDMLKRAVPIMRARGQGIICNITSGSLTAPFPFLSAYRSAKWALSGLSETLRVELAPHGIRVIEILPGLTESGLNQDSMTQTPAGAINFPAYKEAAELLFNASRTQFAKPPTPGSVAAKAIIDAILDEDGPMRYGTDDGSIANLEKWRNQRDEVIYKETVSIFEPILPNQK